MSKQDLADGRRAALGDRLRELRRHRDLTQEKLAVKAGMHRTFLTEVETAPQHHPRPALRARRRAGRDHPPVAAR